MKKTKFSWVCIHCRHRNIEPLAFQFDIPHQYIAEWACSRCDKFTKISFSFGTDLPEKRYDEWQ